MQMVKSALVMTVAAVLVGVAAPAMAAQVPVAIPEPATGTLLVAGAAAAGAWLARGYLKRK